MGNRFSADDLENWKPKTLTRRRTQSQHRKSQQTQEYMIIHDKIDKHSLHLTREPSKHSRLNYMHALCDILSDIEEHSPSSKHKNNNNNHLIIKSLSLWNWRFLGSNDKYILRLATALQNNQHIDTLHLVNCHIDCRNKIRILIEALKRRNILLTDIDLSGNNFGNDENAIKLLAIFLSTYHCTSNLQKITLRATKLQDDQFTNFIQILSQSSTLLDSLELFSVTHNKLKAQSMDYLTKWLLSRQHQQYNLEQLKSTDILIKHLSSFCPKNRKIKSLNLALTTNPIKDSGVKRLIPLMESNVCISELHLRSCCITTRGIVYLLDAYLIRQQRVIEQYDRLIYNVLNEWMDIPLYLCSIIVQHIADWRLDERLSIHFGLSRCILSEDGFNNIISQYIIHKKLIAKCIDIRMKDTRNTDINIINIYKLFHYLKYTGNSCLGRLMFCVSSDKFNIANQIMQLLPTNITEIDIDMVINNIMYEQTKYNKNYFKTDSISNNDDELFQFSNQQHLITQNMNNLITQQNELLNDINSLMDLRQSPRKKKMEDILRDPQVADVYTLDASQNMSHIHRSFNEDDEDDEDHQAIVDMILLEKLRKLHIKLKHERATIYDNGDISFQLSTNSDYGDFDITHSSYIGEIW